MLSPPKGVVLVNRGGVVGYDQEGKPFLLTDEQEAEARAVVGLRRRKKETIH